MNAQLEEFDVEETRRELELVAKALVTTTVLLYVRPPLFILFAGQAYLDSRGVRSIDIHPEEVKKGLHSFYITALHECGHHAMNHCQPGQERPPEIEKLYSQIGACGKLSEEQIIEHDTDPEEIEADSFQQAMDHLARNKAFDLFGDDRIENRIRVLKNFHIQR